MAGSVRRLLLPVILISCAAPPARDSLVLRIAMWGPLGDLTANGGDSALASLAQPWVFEKVVTVDDGGDLKPVLAAHIDRRQGSSIRFEIRHDAQFSDGSPVTEDDVVRSLAAGGLRVRRADHSLIVESGVAEMPPEPLLLQTYVSRQSAGKLIGSGPFVVASASATELRLLRRSPQPGRINEVRLVSYPSPQDAFAHTLKGDANMMLDLEPRWLEFFKGVPSLQVIRSLGHGVDAILFNARLPRRERVQLAAVLESQRVRDLAYGEGECAEKGSDAESPTPPSGPPVTILAWGPFERLALAARRALGARGGEIIFGSPQETLARLRTRDFDLATIRPLRWPPSVIAMMWVTGTPDNPSGYSNPAVDRAAAADDWPAAEALLKEDPPAAFVCTRQQPAVVDARIKNARLGPYEALETLPEWEVAQ